MTNLEACLKKFWKRLDEWVMIFWPSTGRQSNVGCMQQNVGSCVMWNPRVYPFIHCKGSTEGTRRIMAFTTPHHNTKDSGVVSCVTSSSWVASYPESFNDKGQEVIISYNTYPTSASTSTTWLGGKCGCTYPPEHGHLSVNIHSPPSNRSRNY